ncbi:MAG: hypothetical protein JO271_08730 [Verrucomicrobia bacterium]|nr:hypothetical protein [Verrucomicrobiota bacterium]
MRVFDSPFSRAPEVQLLSNGRYHLVISNAGGGYSRWRDLAITRWREDTTRDCWGAFIYLRDPETGDFWSVGYQPTLRPMEEYRVTFTATGAEFRQRQAGFEIATHIWVSAEDDVEVRRVVVTNHSSRTRSIELTSYSEVVLAVPAADLAHPAFSNLFVQTEFVRAASAILANRRPRAQGEQHPWLIHSMIGEEGSPDELSGETDRARFIGRGRTAENPAAMERIGQLSNTVGSVLDPIVSLRRTFTLAPDSSIRVDFITGLAETRHGALALAEKYHAPQPIAASQEHVNRQLTPPELNDAEIDLYGRLASSLIYPNRDRRSDAAVLVQNRLGQKALWRHGISGDLPIVLLHVTNPADFEVPRQLIEAQVYWRREGLSTDLIILIEQTSEACQALIDRINSLIRTRFHLDVLEKSGGIFVRHQDQLSAEEFRLFQSAARLVLTDQAKTIGEQLEKESKMEVPPPALVTNRSVFIEAEARPMNGGELLFQNGTGGFTPDGREYVISLQPGQTTPVPWVNVIANPGFGTVVSESGGAYTWAENSHELRLTPWNNDPISDVSGEAFYLRDDETGTIWSPTPSPARGNTPYLIRHGFGYTVFEHVEHGIESELTIYVAIDAAVKFAAFRLRNISGAPRRISVTGYWEWVFSDLRQRSALHVQTEVDNETGALSARNFYNVEFSHWIAFLDTDESAKTFTGDRNEFIGRNGSLSQPAALRRQHLSGQVGAGLDACGAVQVTIDLPDHQERETCFRLGAATGPGEVRQLIHRFRGNKASRRALEAAQQYWTGTLGKVHVETPDPSVNLMANGWLLYQVLSCRLWGRTGFYQSGGAFGFRDQLQDVMALVHADPGLTREHILRAAAQQFREGDVEHWWHPPSGQGVRTHTSDDYLWLPYVTWQYILRTGDTAILDEQVAFIEGRPLRPDEADYYDLPKRSDESASIYEHCVRAIRHGLKFGQHGLPLIGSCDWNDGMNLVGKEGRGESVWLGFFLYDVLQRFEKLARERSDNDFAELCRAQAGEVRSNIEKHAWDGNWYRRAYFDNGEPLGSHLNSECQIDSLPQSWSVISGAGEPERARKAMEAVNERLVKRAAKLIQLLDPPFDRSELNPGYIKGYVPGVRENGGQYTHAAIWTVMASALQGNDELAWELFALLNPVNHGTSPDDIQTYKVEPYVIAADVYAVAPHTGRGGWTWYTGSAGWMYRTLVETLLGLQPQGGQLCLEPRLPKKWEKFRINYRYGETTYHIDISRVSGGTPGSRRIYLDGKEIPDATIPLVDDRQEHRIEVELRADSK